MEPNQGVLNSTFLKEENYGPATVLILWYDQAQMAFTALFYTAIPEEICSINRIKILSS